MDLLGYNFSHIFFPCPILKFYLLKQLMQQSDSLIVCLDLIRHHQHISAKSSPYIIYYLEHNAFKLESAALMNESKFFDALRSDFQQIAILNPQ